jgi:ABC-2 type transport system ATP-binding protein
MPEGISLCVRGLSKKLKQNQALDKASLEFRAGGIHGLIGPDGAGKTTLLRHLIGLLKPDSGEILWKREGKPLSFSQVRPSMAYMPQQQSLYPELSVSEHLDFFADLYNIPHEVYAKRRAELLHITRLEPFQDRPAGKLSGGMYKKLGLMCALLQSPTVILLDEPTNGVDPISRREFWDLLYRLSAQHILILFATAYMDEAARCATIHLLDKGTCLAEGKPQEVLKREKVKSFEELFIRREENPELGRSPKLKARNSKPGRSPKTPTLGRKPSASPLVSPPKLRLRAGRLEGRPPSKLATRSRKGRS